jgi:predicted PurR-regulated permease PerM
VIFFLIWGPKMLAGGLRQIADDETRARVAQVSSRAAWRTQRYVLATGAAAVVVGVATGLLASAAGLPTPLVLGVVVGAASAIPYLGVIFGAVPVLLLAAPTKSGLAVAALAVALVGLQGAHTFALARLTRRGVLRAGPAVIVVCAMVGSDAYGLGGALVAVVAGILAIALIESATDDRPQASTWSSTASTSSP